MNILLIYKDYYPPVKGGIEGHINLLAHGLKQRGASVRVLVSNTDFRTERVCDSSVPVVLAPEFGRVSSAPLNPSLPMLIRKLGKEADILHYHLPNPTAVISHIISGLKNNIVVTYHSDIVRQKILGIFFSPILHYFLRRTNRIIATSPNYMESSAVLQRYSNKTEVIELGINIKRFSNGHVPEIETSRLQARYGHGIILFVGKFRYYKCLPVLLKAMCQVQGNLLLIGSGPEESKLRRMVVDFGIAHKVHFLGELSDRHVDAYYSACDVFVLPSCYRSEAFGVVLLEAMASGSPVVSTELGTGTTYNNLHRKTGMVVPPGNPKILSLALNFLLENPHARSLMGNQAYDRVCNLFSNDRMVDNTLNLYQKVAEENKHSASCSTKSSNLRETKC